MASSRELSPGGLRRVAAEQAALRRVAMLVARGVEPDLVFAVVAEEVSALFNTDLAMITRLELDGELTVMAGHGLAHFEPGARFQLDPRLAAIVSAGQTGRASRFDADDPRLATCPWDPGGGSPLLGRCPDPGRGPCLGLDRRRVTARAAVPRHRAGAGRVYRTGRYRDHQRPGPRGVARPRPGTGGAAPGGHAGGPGGAAGGGVRRGRRGGRAGARRRHHRRDPV